LSTTTKKKESKNVFDFECLSGIRNIVPPFYIDMTHSLLRNYTAAVLG